MKHITKGAEPQELIDFKAAENDDWKPNYDNLTNEAKAALRTSLMWEQGWTCCYCERRLVDNDSHIEHLRPRSRPEFAEVELDYDNLLCSCQNRLKPGEPQHCGVAKGDWYEEALMVSPLDPMCEDRLHFAGDGAIYPRADDDLAAKETISRLRLDIDKLQALRAAAIAALADLNPEEVHACLQRDSAGMFPEFFVAIRQVLG
ncbi:MAG: TIGR02646 family protein [Phycisphaerae bacterium]|nr:TIGR02646 family protein [Phycisphaerae bacterium]